MLTGNYVVEAELEAGPFGEDYVFRKVVRQTEKAFLLECYISQYKTVYKWVGKKACKIDENGRVFVPCWLVPSRAVKKDGKIVGCV